MQTIFMQMAPHSAKLHSHLHLSSPCFHRKDPAPERGAPTAHIHILSSAPPLGPPPALPGELGVPESPVRQRVPKRDKPVTTRPAVRAGTTPPSANPGGDHQPGERLARPDSPAVDGLSANLEGKGARSQQRKLHKMNNRRKQDGPIEACEKDVKITPSEEAHGTVLRRLPGPGEGESVLNDKKNKIKPHGSPLV